MVAAVVLAAGALILCWPDPPPRCPPSVRTRPGAATTVRSGRIAVAAVVIALLPVAPVVAAAVPAAALAAVAWRRRSARNRERDDLVRALPDALDLCTVVLGAGGTVGDTVAALAEHGPGPVRGPAEAALRLTRHGARLDDALRQLRHDLGPVFQPLTGALLLANEQGGPIGVLLARLTTEAAGGRRRLGELRARRLPVALLGPLILCSLPAVLVGAVVPLALVSLSALEW